MSKTWCTGCTIYTDSVNPSRTGPHRCWIVWY